MDGGIDPLGRIPSCQKKGKKYEKEDGNCKAKLDQLLSMLELDIHFKVGPFSHNFSF